MVTRKRESGDIERTAHEIAGGKEEEALGREQGAHNLICISSMAMHRDTQKSQEEKKERVRGVSEKEKCWER